MPSLSSKIESIASSRTSNRFSVSSALIGAGATCVVMAALGLFSSAAPRVHQVSVSLTQSRPVATQASVQQDNGTETAQSLSEVTPAAGEKGFSAAAALQMINADTPEPKIQIAPATADTVATNAATPAPRPTQTVAQTVAKPAAKTAAQPMAQTAAATPAPKPQQQAKAETAAQLSAPAITSRKVITLGKGGTLAGLLTNRAGVPHHQAYLAVGAMTKVYDPRNMHASDKVTVLFAKKVFEGMKVTERDGSTVTVSRAGDDSFGASVMQVMLHPVVREFNGTIGGSLYLSARKKGVPDNVILAMIKLYKQSVDFKHGVKPTDLYKILYREYAREDGTIDKAKGTDILYADLVLGHKNMPLYRYKDAHGVVGYYDEHGKAAQKSIWRRPIHDSWISSTFGPRIDPITHHRGFHPGVDYAADTGTPIMAAGDGVITERHWWGGYGRYIRIRHSRHLSTAYGHMSRFKKGLHVGSRVKQGEVIGYVGMTGHATGPHLHFEILVNGRQRNPLTVPLPHFGKSLHGHTLLAFEHHIRDVTDTYRLAERENGPLRVALNTAR